MELAYKIAVGGVVTAILASALRSYNRELSLLIGLTASAVLAAAGLTMAREVRIRLADLAETAEIGSQILSPLAHVCAVEILTRLSGLFCRQAGEDTLGKVVELCGALAAVYASLPLLDAVLSVARELLGG